MDIEKYPGIESLDWPAYDSNDRLTMELNEKSKILKDPYAVERQPIPKLLEKSWTDMGL